MNRSIRRGAFVLLTGLFITGLVTAKGEQEQSLLIGVEDVQSIVSAGDTVILDIRDERSYEAGHLPGAMLVPLPVIESAAQSILEMNASVITYCSCPAEESSLAAAFQLRDAGVENVYVLVGGYEEWVKQNKPIVRGSNPL